MTNEEAESSRGCRNALLVGCGVLSLVALAVLILVAVNFGTIRDTVGQMASEAKETLGELMEVRRELVAAYGTTSVSVNKHSGPSGTTLIVEFTNPSFLEAEQIEPEAKAKEIARFTKSNYGPVEELEGITVVFTSKTGAGISVSRHRSYHFSMEELSEPNPPTVDELPNAARPSVVCERAA